MRRRTASPVSNMSVNHLFNVLHNRHDILTSVEYVNIINWNTKVQLNCNT